jgi:hypothetical protein
MTWTSPDTGVADRPDEGPLVLRRPSAEQHGLIMPSRVASTHAGQARRLGITLRVPLATRGPAEFPGLWLWPPCSPEAGRHCSSVACSQYCHDGWDMFRVRYELDASQRYQWRPGGTVHSLAGPGYRTQCLRDGTASAGPPPLPRLSPADWTSFTDANVIFARRAGSPAWMRQPCCPNDHGVTPTRPGPREAWVTRAGRGHERPGSREARP